MRIELPIILPQTTTQKFSFKNQKHVDTKQVISVLEDMPETFEITHLFHRILLLKKLKTAEMKLEGGKGLATIEAKRKLNKWVTSLANYNPSQTRFPG